MAPQFNLLAGRFEVFGDNWAYASKAVQGGCTWITLYVRGSRFGSYVDRRRVKGVELTEYN